MVERANAIASAQARRAGVVFAYEPLPAVRRAYLPDVHGDPFETGAEQIDELLERVETAVAGVKADLASRASLSAARRHVLYSDADGREVSTTFLLSTLLASAVVRDPHRPGDGHEWIAGERGVRDLEADGPERIGAAAAQHAIEATRARSPPAGRHRVLCDNTLSGVLAHESFGHLTEYDLVAMRWSRLHGCLGETFAAEQVSVVDAPTVAASPREGIRLPFDEEGVEGRPIRVLDRGRLAHWLHVRGSARLEGQAPTGNGRALNARAPPIVRMRNTYFEPGDLTVEEAIEQLRDGVYLIGGRGGAPSSTGDFMFTALRGYLVEGGELRAPLRSTAISGNIFDCLRGVEGLTRDLRVMTTNLGGCGKWNQSYLPIGMGGPHVLLDSALIGGTS